MVETTAIKFRGSSWISVKILGNGNLTTENGK